MTDETTITLTRPLRDAKGQEIKTITIREPNVADLIVSEKAGGNVGRVAAIIARQSGLPMPIIETMSARDFNACDKALGALMGNEPETDGETPPS